MCIRDISYCKVNKEDYENLYKAKSLNPDWCWTRCRVSVETSLDKNVLPEHFVTITHTQLPLTHSNMLVFNIVKGTDNWDVYCRVPLWYEDNTEYVKDIENDILLLIQEKIPNSLAKMREPMTRSTNKDLRGPLPYCMYSEEQKRKFKQSYKKHWVNLSPEVWETLDWEGRLKAQKDHLEEIIGSFLNTGSQVNNKRTKNDKTIFKR